MCSRLSARKHFVLPAVDIRPVADAAKMLTSMQAGAMYVHCRGGHYTNDILSKFAFQKTDRCTACGEPDSRAHRILSCKAVDQVRKKISQGHKVWDDLSPTTKHFGLVSLDECAFALRQEVVQFQFVLPTSLTDLTEADVFTDGTCTDPVQRVYALAAGAASVAVGFTQSRPFHAAMVPGGDQTIFRGEIIGGAIGLCVTAAVNLYSDNLAFVKGANRRKLCLMQGNILPQTDHQDVWIFVEEALKRHVNLGCVNIYHVKAHRDPAVQPTVQLAYTAYHNNQVDE